MQQCGPDGCKDANRKGKRPKPFSKRPDFLCETGPGEEIVSCVRYASVWMARPERSFGSNQVVFGGMMLPLSAMFISCSMETG